MAIAAKETSDSKSRYGFYGRLRREFPSQVIVDITEVCNLACIHCPHNEFKNSRYYNASHLDPELNARMVDEVKEHGKGITQYIRYASNGESLLHPHWYEMIRYAAHNSGVMVTLTTNGTLLNEKRTQMLLDSGVHLIDISIDAFTAETYAKVRIKGDLSVTRTNVLRLINWVKESGLKTKVVVSFVEQPINLHEREDFEAFWKDQGADYVVIRRLHSCSGAKTTLAAMRRSHNQGKKRRPCLYPWERIVLNARGELSFCPSDWVHGSVIEDYRNTTIRECWQGSFYKELRQAHLSGNFSKHRFCRDCPDWEATRWPWEGRSYADMIEEFKGGE